ncbi:2'-5' RNA ligase family protein [Saccharothrix coeruleofusca]|uniref:RNA 2',3'-cyclic phosphodiesterase n=1 Tax=Saccharothrix coeruleofusca TaxID=33919 RepID=A0A918EDK6_9PSEU|nr:2'-5' RNA ligase family protein [Saccharothrix coeruleofusca]GGP48442.1 hypothetical protein GCM10010185_20650 [Saccharothrix coeruleofusca]
MRLFTALFPPPEAVEELAAALAPLHARYPELRWVDPARWHITLRFFGETEPADQLTPFEGLAGPVLRLRDTGHFPGVLWVGVTGALEPLGTAAGAGPDWRPHLTVARSRHAKRWPRLEFTGREWTAGEVALVRSDLGRGYTVLDRVFLSTSNG